MVFYELTIQSQPKIEFACSVTTENYRNIVNRRANMIEISTYEGIPVLHETDCGECLLQPGSVFILFPDLYSKSRAAVSGKVTISTVAVRVGDMQYVRHSCDTLEEAAEIVRRGKKKDAIFLPLSMDMEQKSIQVISLIKTLISNYLKNTAIGGAQCLSKWYELVAFISEEFTEALLEGTKDNQSVSSFYTYKARKYLASHYADKILLTDMAQILNISPDYLGRLFKRDTGMSFRTYLNMLRIQHARQLAYDNTMTLQQIADAVGICDVRYMQRLFSKFYGVSIQACNRIDHEISLYHEKPWNIENLSDDPYVTESDTDTE